MQNSSGIVEILRGIGRIFTQYIPSFTSHTTFWYFLPKCWLLLCMCFHNHNFAEVWGVTSSPTSCFFSSSWYLSLFIDSKCLVVKNRSGTDRAKSRSLVFYLSLKILLVQPTNITVAQKLMLKTIQSLLSVVKARYICSTGHGFLSLAEYHSKCFVLNTQTEYPDMDTQNVHRFMVLFSWPTAKWQSWDSQKSAVPHYKYNE